MVWNDGNIVNRCCFFFVATDRNARRSFPYYCCTTGSITIGFVGDLVGSKKKWLNFCSKVEIQPMSWKRLEAIFVCLSLLIENVKYLCIVARQVSSCIAFVANTTDKGELSWWSNSSDPECLLYFLPSFLPLSLVNGWAKILKVDLHSTGRW